MSIEQFELSKGRGRILMTTTQDFAQSQVAGHILLLRPASFGYNPYTAASNAFQQKPDQQASHDFNDLAVEEFEGLRKSLLEIGVQVSAFDDSREPPKSDAVFPNNWFSTHQYISNDRIHRKMLLYPMFSPNRRPERRHDIVRHFSERFEQVEVHDLSHFEQKDQFLESTGSIIFDHPHKIAYACRSVRTHQAPFEWVCQLLGYEGIMFDALDPNGLPVYHTNVIMAIGNKHAVICLDCIPKSDRKLLVNALEKSGKVIVDLGFEQIEQFAGNMLEVEGEKGGYWVMSESAFLSLSDDQKSILSEGCELLSVPIDTIERLGGGSVRCMMGEIFFN